MLDGKIDAVEKKRRVKKVEELNNVKYAEFRKKTVGSKQRVYIEEIVEDKAFGYTENYLKVFIDLKKGEKNNLDVKVSDLVNTKIVDFDGILLEGDII